jgi:UDP-2,3-diacylglucosamine pyrophosphatase LpxH
MSLVLGDTHGNYFKVKSFLEYKPEEQHIFVGDVFDSYVATDQQIVDCFNLILDSNSILLWGNHELHYLPNAHSYFRCSGYRASSAPIFTHLLSQYKHRLYASFVDEDYLILHGGLHRRLGEVFDNVSQANHWINNEMDWYVNNPLIPESLSPIFNIGTVRGGDDAFGGVFWFTTEHEEECWKFNAITGHTPRSSIGIKTKDTMRGIIKHVYVDTPLFQCYDTTSGEIEDFMPEQYKNDTQMRKILEKTF